MFMKIVTSVMFVVVTGMRSDHHKGEEMKTESVVSREQSQASKLGENISQGSEAKAASAKLMDPEMNFDFFKGKAEDLSEGAINGIKRTLGSTVKGKTCPKEFDVIPDGYDYGVGCALKDLGCKCPSFLDVCATSPRMGKVDDLKNLITRLSVSQLGYCRTGAWVFILSSVLVLLALGGIGFFIYKKRS